MNLIRPIFIILLYLLISTLPSWCSYSKEELFCINAVWHDVIMLHKTGTQDTPTRPKIALVLGGGGGRGFAHIGVIKVLEQEGVPIDIIVGTSVGALIGAFYASGIPIREIEHIAQTVEWNDLSNTSVSSLLGLVLFDRLLTTDKMQRYLENKIGNRRFDELPISFACVAADIQTGERVVLREGPVGIAVRASASIPGIFQPVEYKQRFLVDGGIVDNIPVDVAKMLGADIVIAVNVDADFTKRQVASVYQSIMQAMYIQGSIAHQRALQAADCVLSPRVGDVATFDLDKRDMCINAGVIETRQKIADVRATIILKSLPILMRAERNKEVS